MGTNPRKSKKIPEQKEKHVYREHLLSEDFYLQRSQIIYEMPKLQNVPDNIARKEKLDKTLLIKNSRILDRRLKIIRL